MHRVLDFFTAAHCVPLQVAWAMNGRGEFSFLITAAAVSDGILSAVNASAVCVCVVSHFMRFVAGF